MSRFIVALLALMAAAFMASVAWSDDLYKPGSWPALASDRVATRPGDTLTVIVLESATASNTTRKGTGKRTSLSGELVELDTPLQSGRAELETQFQGSGETARSGKMVAQISVTVDDVMPNGDLFVSGRQSIRINGEKTVIRIQGRVRPADISGSNTVLSSRLADATIDYNGSGFTSRSAQPGLVNRIFNLFGFL